MQRGLDLIPSFPDARGAGALARASGAGEPARAPAAPEISIIITLVDHRQYAIEAVRSWLEGQTAPREAFEVVALADESEPALVRKVEPMLAAHDQLVVVPGARQVDLLRIGAARARAPFLLFTEGHAEAKSSAVAAALSHLAATGADAVSLRSTSEPKSRLERMEQRMFALHAPARMAPDGWNKIFLRGFAIRREAYVAAGGLRSEFGLFSEPALAMALHRLGRPIEVSNDTVIVHHNTTNLYDLYVATANFARGQCAYRAQWPAEYARYLGPLEEWRHRGGASTRLARAAWSDSLRLCRTARDPRLRARAAKAVLALTPVAAFGRHAYIAALASWLAAAVLRTWIWRRHDARLERAYIDTHRHMASFVRTRTVAAMPGTPPVRPIGVGCVGAADLPEEKVFGFHPPDKVGAATFRWSQPLALVPLDLAPGRYRVALDKRGERAGMQADELAVAFNGRVLPATAVAITDAAVTLDIEVDAGAPFPQRLLLLCAPLVKPPHSTDPRALGLPVFTIAIAPIGDQVAALAPAAARERIIVG